PGDLAARIVAHRARRRHVPRWAAVAAAAVGVAAVLAVAPFGSPESRAADAIVRDAATASAQALQTGRAVVTSPDGALPLGDERTYTFDGENLAVDGSGPGYTYGRLRVDGNLYFYWNPNGGSARDWMRDITATNVGPEDFVFDPRGLLGVLAPTAGFELAGGDTVDGVAVTHLRATRPEAIDTEALHLGELTDFPDSRFTALDIWVDGDDVVRRIDFAQEFRLSNVIEIDPATGSSSIPDQPQVVHTSVRFTDIGASITVDAPADARDVNPWPQPQPQP
ncbi:MAG TPA: hypothetical protein VH479_07065, partial [Acidimicrobiales bacterium]